MRRMSSWAKVRSTKNTQRLNERAESLKKLFLIRCSLSVQISERFSWKRLLQKLDKRRLQHELDTHRLFLVTEHNARRSTGVSQLLSLCQYLL